jgi:hypothetical protein
MDPFEGLEQIEKAEKPKGQQKKTAAEKKEEKVVSEMIKAKPEDIDTTQQKAKLIYSIQQYGKNPRLGTYLRQQCNHRFDDGYLKRLSLDDLQLELEKQEGGPRKQIQRIPG